MRADSVHLAGPLREPVSRVGKGCVKHTRDRDARGRGLFYRAMLCCARPKHMRVIAIIFSGDVFGVISP